LETSVTAVHSGQFDLKALLRSCVLLPHFSGYTVYDHIPLADRLKTHISPVHLQISFDSFAKFFILFRDLLHDLRAKDRVITSLWNYRPVTKNRYSVLTSTVPCGNPRGTTERILWVSARQASV